MNTPPPKSSQSWNMRFVEARNLRMLTNTQIHEAMGVTLSAVSMWETGTTKELTFENGLLLCAVLGVRPEWLRHGTLPMEADDVAGTWSISTHVLTASGPASKERAAAVSQKRAAINELSNIYEHAKPAAQAALMSLSKLLFVMDEADIATLISLTKRGFTDGFQINSSETMSEEERAMLADYRRADEGDREFARIALRKREVAASETQVSAKKHKANSH